MDRLTNNVKAKLASKLGNDVVKYVIEPYLDISEEEIKRIEGDFINIENGFRNWMMQLISIYGEEIDRIFSCRGIDRYSKYDIINRWDTEYHIHLFLLYSFSGIYYKADEVRGLFTYINKRKHALKCIDNIVLESSLEYEIYNEYKDKRYNLLNYYLHKKNAHYEMEKNLIIKLFIIHIKKTYNL